MPLFSSNAHLNFTIYLIKHRFILYELSSKPRAILNKQMRFHSTIFKNKKSKYEESSDYT